MSQPATAANHKALASGSVPCAYALFLVAFALCAAATPAQTGEVSERRTIPQSTRRIVVGISHRKLALLDGDRVIKIYDVAVGAQASPSPAGEFQIAQRLENPGYYHPGTIVAPGQGNPLGTRWIGLNVKGFGIHGTNRPRSIGKNASHGCIRLRNHDVEDLFARVQEGDRVSLVAERTDEVARLFGGTVDSKSSNQTLLVSNEQPALSDDAAQGER
jgi:lipoprotein-anchoring transpeptidase ErfK/SrfK